MCGFVGFSGKIEKRKETLNKMMDRIAHRGPDMADEYIDGDVALGFRRLSILDLSEAGRQPMADDPADPKYVILHNGEVYNFAEIRKGLEEKGYTFVHPFDDTAVATPTPR